MALADGLKARAAKLSGKALERLFADEKRAAKLSSAMQAVQDGREKLTSLQDGALHAAQWATGEDARALGRRMSSIRRRLEDLDARLARLEARLEER